LWNLIALLVIELTGDDMFSDGHVFNEVDGVFYEVEGKVGTGKVLRK